MKLKYLINVFNVWPAFLLPVFYDEEKFFFQKIQSNYIESFVEADLHRFAESYSFEVQDEIVAKVNECAIYAVGFNQSDYFYGNNKAIIDDYQKNLKKYEQDEDFKKTIISFVNKYSNSIMVSDSHKYIQNFIIHHDFKMEHSKISSAFKKGYFENDYSVLYCVQNLTVTIDDIYLFKKIIDNNLHLNMTRNVLYKKHNSDAFMYLSFQKQANIINFVIENQPREYYRRRNNLFFDKMPTYLWNVESIYRVFKDNIIKKFNLLNRLNRYPRHGYWQIREYLEKNLQDILTEWHLKLDDPILDLSKGVNTKENLDDFIEHLLLDAEQEESELYLLNVISLSRKANINMIVAQNFFNKKMYNFKIKEGRVYILDIIDFLELLYKEHKKKFTIIINDNEIFDNQQFYSWIEDNHDRFSIKSLPSFLGVSI